MAKFYTTEFGNDASASMAKAQRHFADLLFHELQRSVLREKAPEVLANHLGVLPQDVEEWLAGKALPCKSILGRLITMLRGNNYFDTPRGGNNVADCSWAKIYEFVGEAENVQALMNTKLTKSGAKEQLISEDG